MLQLKWRATRRWSKSIEAGGNKNQGLRHPQEWDLQSVDKHNVVFRTPYFESFPTNIHYRRYILEKKVGGQTTIA